MTGFLLAIDVVAIPLCLLAAWIAEGTFSADRNTIAGRWEWPGGGYMATMTRIDG